MNQIEASRPADEAKQDRLVFLPSANLHPDELKPHGQSVRTLSAQAGVEKSLAAPQPVLIHREPTPTILSPKAGGVAIDLKRAVSTSNPQRSNATALQRSATERIDSQKAAPVSAASFYKSSISPVLVNRTVDKAALMKKMSPGSVRKTNSGAPSPVTARDKSGNTTPKSIRGGVSKAGISTMVGSDNNMQ